MSTSLRCQRNAVGPIHSFYGIFQIAYCRLHIYTTGQAFLDHIIYTRKHLGPSNVPCGTPPLGCPGGEKLFPILTCWVLYNRKVAIHLRICGGKSYCFNFASSILWLIRSKALLKSSSATLM